MARTVANMVIGHLSDDNQITSEVLLTTMFLIERWKYSGPIAGPDEELTKLLDKEEFNTDTMESIRELLVRFASSTNSVELFQQTVSVLRLFGDKRHIPLFQTWLLRETQSLLKHYNAMWSLVIALQDNGEKVLDRQSLSLTDVDENLNDAREYLARSLGITIPW